METHTQLDGAQEGVQDSKSGLVTEDDVYQSVARQMGWTPQDEWTRDPAKWVDARAYVNKTPTELKSLKERLKRTTQAAEAVIDDTRRRVREEVETELKEATAANDPERVRAAAERYADVKAEDNKPHPATLRWIERNSWFEDDLDAQAVARNAVVRAAKQGLSVEDQLKAAEDAVKPRFPEYFPSERRGEEGKEVKLSERKPPQVAEGTRTTRTQSKEKSFADVPAQDQALYRKHFQKRYEGTGLTSEKAQEKYAKAYWANKGD